MRIRALLACCVMWATAAAAPAREVSPPLAATLPLRQGGEVRGRIVQFDGERCQVLLGAAASPRPVRWDAVQPRAVLALHERLLGNTGTAQEWLDLGRLLHHAPGGGAALSARAFGRALKLDPGLQREIESARSSASPSASSAPPAPAPPAPATQVGAGETDGIERRSRGGLKFPPPPAATRPDAGNFDAPWGALDEAQLARATEELKRYAAKVHALSSARLELYETRYFLFYSNLPQSEARKWSEVLDRMHARLAHMFALEPVDRNLWHGKALITVFLSRDDFLKFEKAAYHNDRAQNSGFSHEFNDGRVHIVFYRARSDLDFARLLVHESTHGFLHRYRSPARIPSWANEGLAEVMEYELVPHEGLKMANDARAKSELRRPEPLKNLFNGRHIENFQYPISRTLTEFMISQNRRGYVDFINSIKDGLTWEDALVQKYGVSLEQLVRAYGNFMGVPGLAP